MGYRVLAEKWFPFALPISKNLDSARKQRDPENFINLALLAPLVR